MKILQLTAATLFVFVISCRMASSQAIVGKIYITSSDQIAVFGLDARSNLDSASKYSVRKGTKFSIVGFDEQNNVLITFWRYGYKDSASGKYHYTRPDTITKAGFRTYQDTYEFIGHWANYKKFALNPKVLNSSCKEYFGSAHEFTWGVMTLPIKVRLGNKGDRYFQFEERLNLGFTFGLRKQLKGYVENSLNYLVGFGVTNARTDSASVKDLSQYDGNNALALSFYSGVLYQHESFQVGLFLGTDHVPGKLGRAWLYQGKPWLGLAIGVALFSKHATDSDNKNNTQ